MRAPGSSPYLGSQKCRTRKPVGSPVKLQATSPGTTLLFPDQANEVRHDLGSSVHSRRRAIKTSQRLSTSPIQSNSRRLAGGVVVLTSHANGFLEYSRKASPSKHSCVASSIWRSIEGMNFPRGFHPSLAHNGFLQRADKVFEYCLCPFNKRTWWKNMRAAVRHLRMFHIGLADRCGTWYTLQFAFLFPSRFTDQIAPPL